MVVDGKNAITMILCTHMCPECTLMHNITYISRINIIMITNELEWLIDDLTIQKIGNRIT